MAKKAEIEQAIDTLLADASGIQASEHRDVLKDEANSVLENIYPTPITEDTSATLVITDDNSNFSYDLVFTKTGRKINMSGTFTNISGGVVNAGNPVLEVIDDEFYAKDTVYAICKSSSSADVIGVALSSTLNLLRLTNTVLDGETFRINFNYNANE